MVNSKNRYKQLIESIFIQYYKKGAKEVLFERTDLVKTAEKLGIKLPKNLGDVVYSFRYRALLPASIKKHAPEGLEWVIRPVGQAKYKFSLSSMPRILPNKLLAETKIPDATPGIILKYALNDEQGLLAKIRYNRLVDIFTAVTCYSLQSHLRTTVPEMGQIETDEIYVGVDQRGAQYVFPVQAKGGTDQLGIVQIEQDFALCSRKFSSLICRPIAAQFIKDNLIAMFAFEENDNGIAVSSEKHYRLVNPEEMTDEDLKMYRERSL
jgi:hypothetical protein